MGCHHITEAGQLFKKPAPPLLAPDPVQLVRGKAGASEGGLVEAYVNDRAYAASSFLSVAIARILGGALNARCDRPELAEKLLDLTAAITPVRIVDNGLAQRLFAPLGYEVEAKLVDVPDSARVGTHYRVVISATTPLHRLLNHLYVLVPVLDGSKHYWVGEDEVEKLFRFGKDWLPPHPERELITTRYLQRAPSLARAAIARLAAADDGPTNEVLRPPGVMDRERSLEKPLRLQDRRISTVVETLHSLGAKSVVDIGCGEGDLIAAIARDPLSNFVLFVHRQFIYDLNGGRWPGPEWEHGSHGWAQYVVERTGSNMVTTLLSVYRGNPPARKSPCPCGSSVIWAHCHKRAITDVIRALPFGEREEIMELLDTSSQDVA